MSLRLKRLFAAWLVIAFSFSGSPVWAERGRIASSSFFNDEEGPFTKRFYRGRILQGLNIPVGQLPQIPLPVLSVGEAPSLDISLPEFKDSPYLNEILSVPNDPYYSSKGSLYSNYSQLEDLWGVKLLNAEAAWNFTRGLGVVVAVVDTGVYLNHAELQGNIWSNQREKDGVAGVDDDGNGFIDDVNGWDFVENDKDPSDLNGHGTHVAGIIGALKDNGKGITGIAPEADIMAVRVLDSSGGGSWADVSAGVRYAASMGAKVINLSLGGFADMITKTEIQSILGAVQYARSMGAIIVAAAGNSNGDIANTLPAAFEEVISVGALRHAYDTYYGNGPLGRADFSEKGEELDFMAPGADILSLAVNSFTYTGYKRFLSGSSYYSVSDGTSMAAPMVSGLIALLLAQNPLQTFSDIYRRLKYSSGDLGIEGFDNLRGWGAVNAFKALSEDYYDNGVVKKHFYSNGRILAYNVSGVLETETFPNGDIRSYFPSGNLQTFFESSSGNTYEYLDENFYGNDAEGHGQGRKSKKAFPGGKETRFIAYHPGTDKPKIVEFYQSGSLIKTVEYAADGMTAIRLALANGDAFNYYVSGNLKNSLIQGILQERLDENFYGNDPENFGRGRLSRTLLANTQETRYLEYYPNTDKPKKIELYQSGVFQKTQEFYLTGQLLKETFLSGETKTYYPSGNRLSVFKASTGMLTEYNDENFYGKNSSGFGQGRKSKEITAGGKETRYIGYLDGTAIVTGKSEYSEGVLKSAYAYAYDFKKRLTDSVQIENDALGRVYRVTETKNHVYDTLDRPKSRARVEKDGTGAVLKSSYFGSYAFDSTNQVKSYKETVRNSSGRVIQIIERSDHSYNSSRQTTGLLEVIKNRSGAVLSNTKFTGYTYDASARVTSYTQIQRNAQGAKTLRTNRYSDLVYDDWDRVTSYRKRERRLDGDTNFITDFSNYSYDFQDRPVGYVETRKDSNEQTFAILVYSETAYDAKGRVKSYKLTDQNVSGHDTGSHLFSSYAYDASDRVAGFTQIDKASDGKVILKIARSNYRYDALNEATGFKQVESDASGKFLRSYKFSNTIYDEAGRVKGYQREDRSSFGEVLRSFKHSNFVYDGASRVVSYKRVDKNARGRVIGTHWITLNSDGTTRSDNFERALLVSSTSSLEAAAFGGTGYLDMLNQKADQRQTSSSQNPQASFLAGLALRSR